jgi:hypothetical protein
MTLHNTQAADVVKGAKWKGKGDSTQSHRTAAACSCSDPLPQRHGVKLLTALSERPVEDTDSEYLGGGQGQPGESTHIEQKSIALSNSASTGSESKFILNLRPWTM